MTPGINYIRNSVKVVIDAYNGTTTFYLADPDDPIALTLANVFPDFLDPLDSMPEELQSHLRYPEGIFTLQTTMYSTYHMTNPSVFYNKEDQWEVPIVRQRTDGAVLHDHASARRREGRVHSDVAFHTPGAKQHGRLDGGEERWRPVR